MNTSKLTALVYNNLKAKFSELNWCIYPSDEKLNKFHVPIANLELISLEHLESAWDLNNIDVMFNIRLIYADKAKDKLNIRDKALEIGCFLQDNTFENKQIEKLSILSSQPDNFSPVVDGYICWQIDFIIKIFIGESSYPENDISPDFELEINENAD